MKVSNTSSVKKYQSYNSMTTTNDTCAICVEPFSYRNKKFDCKCGFSACRTCVVRYVEDTEHEPKCMSCNEVWSRGDLYHMMSHTVCNRMIAHAVDVQVRREKAMLPNTVPFVELRSQQKKLQNEIAQKIIDHEKIIKNLSNTLKTVNRNIGRIVDPNLSTDSHEQTSLKDTDTSLPTTVIGSCAKPDCRGYICSTSGMCCICSTTYCKRCIEEKLDDHECNEDVLASVQLVRESCKPCPKCRAPIQKIYGCNDMFCTSCSTAFCWRTLKIHQTGNSNPHYYEWIRDNTTRSNYYDPDTIFFISKGFTDLQKNEKDSIVRLLQKIRHFNTTVQNTSNLHNESAHRYKAMNMRANYIENAISEKQLKKDVKRMQTDIEHTSMIVESTNYMMRIREAVISSNTILKNDGFVGLVNTIRPIIDEFNERSTHIGKIFGRKPHAFIEFPTLCT